jgi:hypothetical protein
VGEIIIIVDEYAAGLLGKITHSILFYGKPDPAITGPVLDLIRG